MYKNIIASMLLASSLAGCVDNTSEAELVAVQESLSVIDEAPLAVVESEILTLDPEIDALLGNELYAPADAELFPEGAAKIPGDVISVSPDDPSTWPGDPIIIDDPVPAPDAAFAKTDSGALQKTTTEASIAAAKPIVILPRPRLCFGAPYPIILAHGLGGPNLFQPAEYFYQVKTELEHYTGRRVFVSSVSAYGSSEDRGAQLKEFVKKVLIGTRACKVNIIGHSQGGLDARVVASTYRYAGGIGSITSISTPHMGTPLADKLLTINFLAPKPDEVALVQAVGAILQLTPQQLLDPVFMSALVDGLLALSVQESPYFNAQNPDDRRVRYFSAAGRSLSELDEKHCEGGTLWANTGMVDTIDPALLALGQEISINNKTGNDGVVPVDSSHHGEFLGCVPADHFDEVGQLSDPGPDPNSGFHHKSFYKQIAKYLRINRL